MLRLLILSLALIPIINSSNIPRTTATPPALNLNDKTFVKMACTLTKYPTVCYIALSPYSSTIKSDPIKLCLTSLSVNFKSAKSASSIVSSLFKKFASRPEVPIILKDCLKKMEDTADEFKHVVAEIMNSARISKGKNNKKLEAWAISAFIDVTMCMGKFKEMKVNAEILKVVMAVSELSMTTSNTLALCKL
ncbi:unnamed protein product [Eruca vesicaria subsp. sativa]|uniref:Pectinesterase inhibitor domain-containing protein n=1 Tax=Eruca vesicaria subsp. sativa TaxID=29727 RepID=A0ABC8LMA9_ERUVS|nr:unnamed protein product [Eruca vesicaria subsp. sativa]